MSAADASLLNFWSFLYSAGTVLVILGVILEGAEIVVRRRTKKNVEEPWLPASETNLPKWVHVIGDCGWLILVLGLVLEQIAHGQLTIITDREGQRLTGELKAVTEELVKIEAPRTITKEQRELFISATSKSPKGSINCGLLRPDNETLRYFEAVRQLLGSAGYTIASSVIYTEQTVFLRDTDKASIAVIVDTDETAPAHAHGIVAAFKEARMPVVFTRNRLSTNAPVPSVVGGFSVGAGEVMVIIIEKRF